MFLDAWRVVMSLSTNLVTLIYSIKWLFLMFVSIDMMAHCTLNRSDLYTYNNICLFFLPSEDVIKILNVEESCSFTLPLYVIYWCWWLCIISIHIWSLCCISSTCSCQIYRAPETLSNWGYVSWQLTLYSYSDQSIKVVSKLLVSNPWVSW